MFYFPIIATWHFPHGALCPVSRHFISILCLNLNVWRKFFHYNWSGLNDWSWKILIKCNKEFILLWDSILWFKMSIAWTVQNFTSAFSCHNFYLRNNSAISINVTSLSEKSCSERNENDTSRNRLYYKIAKDWKHVPYLTDTHFVPSPHIVFHVWNEKWCVVFPNEAGGLSARQASLNKIENLLGSPPSFALYLLPFLPFLLLQCYSSAEL